MGMIPRLFHTFTSWPTSIEPLPRAVRRRWIERKIAQAMDRQEIHRLNALAYLKAADDALADERRLRNELNDLNFPVSRELFE